jgi:hypothetical protein
MSIVTSVIRDFGMIGSHLLKIGRFKLSFIRAVPLNIRVERSKAWASPSAAGQFKRNQIVARALDESLARFPLAR